MIWLEWGPNALPQEKDKNEKENTKIGGRYWYQSDSDWMQ